VSRFTVLGAGGYVGRAMVAHLRAEGHEVAAVTRETLAGFLAAGAPAGHVIYAIGLTGDFRARPLETAEAHVGIVARVLAEVALDSFLYLSSTRVYARSELTREDAAIEVAPGVASDLYNITKLAGEALVLGNARPTLRVARLSNVYGPGMGTDSFLGQVLDEGRRSGSVSIHQGLLSTKDYVSIDDVVRALTAIAERGQARLYNVASGRNTTHDAIVTVLARSHGWSVEADGNAAVRFPRIDITRLSSEFAAPGNEILTALPHLAEPRSRMAALAEAEARH